MKAYRIAGAVALILGCGSSEPQNTHHSVRDSAGIQIVENEGYPRAVELGSRLHRIGSIDGPASLYRVTHAFLTDDGGVAVVESSTDLIKFFGPDGSATRTIGGTGRGPGEFTGLWYASIGPADTLIAFDIAGSTSVSIFDPSAAFVRVFPLPQIGRGEPVAIGTWPSGALLVLMQGTGTQPAVGEAIEWGLYNVGLDGSVEADLGQWPVGLYQGGFQIFGHRASFAAGGTHLLYTPGDQFEVRSHDLSGSLIRIVRLNRPRQPVSEDHVDAYWDDFRSRAPSESAFEAMRRRFGEPVVADSMPAYAGLLALEDGALLARWAPVPSDSAEVWDVFDPQGVYLGALTFPPRFRALSATLRGVVGTILDENDVEFVEAYEWVWPR